MLPRFQGEGWTSDRRQGEGGRGQVAGGEMAGAGLEEGGRERTEEQRAVD